MRGELYIVSIVVFLFSFAVAVFVTPLMRRLALIRKYADKKNERTIHKKVTTRLGGTAIYAGISLSLILLYSLDVLRQGIPPLLAGITVIFIIGTLDDIRDIRAHYKLLLQLIACSVVIFSGIRINMFTIPFSHASVHLPAFLSIALTVLWLLLLTNAINFIDGLDGLAAGTSTIACLFLFGISLRAGRADIAVPFLAITGSCLGFLKYNFHPAKVFMGDGGSTTIGFSIACLTLLGTIKAPAVFPLLIPLTALGIPASDLLFAVLRRLKNRKNPLSPDRKHLHHKLLDTGMHHRDVVIIFYSATVLLGLAALTFSPAPSVATAGISLICAGTICVIVKRIIVKTRRNGSGIKKT